MDVSKSWLSGGAVVITGASSGIGRELSLLIARGGIEVIGIARREKPLAELESLFPGKFIPYQMDVTDFEKWRAFAEYLEKNGTRVTALINNAGVMHGFKKFGDLPLEETLKVISTDLNAQLLGVRALLPFVTASSGGIINVASSAAFMTLPGTTVYSAAKAAVRAFTDGLRLEYPGIYVGCMLPGFTDTALFRPDGADPILAPEDAGLIGKVTMPAEKMAKKLLKKILRKSKTGVIGADAKFMKTFSRLMPVQGGQVVKKAIKKFRTKTFAKATEEDPEKD